MALPLGVALTADLEADADPLVDAATLKVGVTDELPLAEGVAVLDVLELSEANALNEPETLGLTLLVGTMEKRKEAETLLDRVTDDVALLLSEKDCDDDIDVDCVTLCEVDSVVVVLVDCEGHSGKHGN